LGSLNPMSGMMTPPSSYHLFLKPGVMLVNVVGVNGRIYLFKLPYRTSQAIAITLYYI